MARFPLALLILAVALAPVACDDGSANTSADALSDIDPNLGSLSGTVSADGSPAANVEVSLDDVQTATTAADGAFRFADITPGTYTITALLEGYQPYSNEITIEAGTARVLFIELSQGTNTPPIISELKVTPDTLAMGGEATATVTASDPDGDELTYTWSTTGDFTVSPNANPALATITAPSTSGALGSVTVTVSDGQGGTVSDTVEISTSISNSAPVIQAFTAAPDTELAPGAVGSLNVSASDPDGDNLTYTWSLDDEARWSLLSTNQSAAITAANMFGATVTVTVTVTDTDGGQASDTLTLTTTPCATGLVDCDENADTGCEDPGSGTGPTCPATSCADPLLAAADRGNGSYWITHTGNPTDTVETYCDMTTDGGGWMLMGTISGADADNWNVETGIWADTSTLGSAADPWADYKDATWSAHDLANAQVLFQRRYDGQTATQVILPNTCLGGKSTLSAIFATYDASIACGVSDVRPISDIDAGLSSATYNVITGVNGLGGADTNGFCWFGGDTNSNTFKGHLLWNQDTYPNSCEEPGHLGGVGVFETGSAQYEVKDITGTNWVNGADYTLTAVSLLVRDRIVLTGDLTPSDPGTWADGALATSCKDYRFPAGIYEYGGVTTGDGIYRIDPDADGPIAPLDVFCDMTTDGGGWTAVAANGENATAETTDAADCYPLVSGDTAYAGCGTITNLMGDFSVPGEAQAAISWRYMMGIAYGDTGYDEKLGYFGIDYGSDAPTAEERIGGSRYTPSFGTNPSGGEIRCTADTVATYIVHYTKACTHNNRPTDIACGKGTIFGHTSAGSMASSARRTLGFTDASPAGSTTASNTGLDDYQDGWSCSDNWRPQSARGARMVLLVR